MNTLKTFVLVFVGLLFCSVLYAQNIESPNKAALMKELEKRNIKYEDLEARLTEEGFDVNNLDYNQLSLEERQRIENIIAELSIEAPEISNVSKEEDQIEAQTQELIVPAKEEVIEQQRSDTEIYGQELFRSGILNVINSSSQVKAPESYVLGQGDQIVISIWGNSQLEENHTIGEDGYIRILDGNVRVFLKGLDLGSARTKIRRILSSEYSFREGEFDLTVNYSRTVRISIYGEVENIPGSFAISGLNTAFNALSLVGGPSDIGSLRKIKLQKADGRSFDIDVYQFMNDPSVQSDFYLDDNDIILVPVLDKLVKISGSVRRPYKYELKSREGLKELIEFAGGLSENAYTKKIQIKRFINNEQKIIDVDWSEYLTSGQSFELLNGDEIFVENIEQAYRNYVSISGELDKPGQYERTDGMRVSDLVNRAGLTDESSRDVIYLVRTMPDGTNELFKLDLNLILQNPGDVQNMLLSDQDKLEVWSQERFADEASVSISGAVRYNGQYPYDRSGNLKVVDAILLAGGLRRDASNFATIHYNDPLNKKQKYYKTIDNLYDLFDNQEDPNNFVLNAFDSLVIQSVNEFEEKLYVRIEGAVNSPGQFHYGDGMSVKDLLIMAGGFKTDAMINNIEVSRVMIQNNEPTQVIVANLEMDRDFNVLSKGVANGEYLLEPYDNIAVRFVREFNFQERIFLQGEVNIPGPYALYEENLRVSDMISKAGGLTSEAFPEGATLFRSDSDLGAVIIKLDEVLRNPRSEFNFILKDGDIISIPKISEFITIRGATRVKDAVSDSNIAEYNQIRVPFYEGKNAKYYIDQFAGGFDKKADRTKVFVEYPNGEIKQTKAGLFSRKYPTVRKGSIITVGYADKEELDESEAKDTDWGKVLTDSVGQAVSILTLILLIERID